MNGSGAWLAHMEGKRRKVSPLAEEELTGEDIGDL